MNKADTSGLRSFEEKRRRQINNVIILDLCQKIRIHDSVIVQLILEEMNH